MAFNKADAEIFQLLTQNVDVVFIGEFHYMKNASKIFKAIFDGRKKVKIFASGDEDIPRQLSGNDRRRHLFRKPSRCGKILGETHSL